MNGDVTAMQTDAKSTTNGSLIATPPRESLTSRQQTESVGSNPPPYPTLSRSSSLSPPPGGLVRKRSPDAMAEASTKQLGRSSPPNHLAEVNNRRQLSPFPSLASRNSMGPSINGSLDSAAMGPFLRRPPSPRLLGSRSISGGSPNVSIDSQHSRLNDRGDDKDKNSASTDGQPFKRWGPASSPSMNNRLPKMYVPTTLSGTDGIRNQDGNQDESRMQSHSLRLPKIQAHLMDLDHYESKSVDSSSMSVNLKRKSEGGEISRANSPFAFSVPSTTISATTNVASRQQSQYRPTAAASTPSDNITQASMRQQGQNIHQDDSPSASQQRGQVIQLIPQRKSCDRCFKMKTKCSRAAPGASPEAPCDGCIRRGCGDTCHTSRPDLPFPRVSLSKRQRRESSLPDSQELSSGEGVVDQVKPIEDWRTKLISNDRSRTHDSHLQQQRLQAQGNQMYTSGGSMTRSLSNNDDKMAQKSDVQRNASGQADRRMYHSSFGVARQVNDAQQSNNNGRLFTSDLRGRTIPPEVDTAAAHHGHPGLAPTGQTPVVPSMSQTLHGAAIHHPNGVSSHEMHRSSSQAVNSLSLQAMQNVPMQLLPKAIGIPALGYFDQLIYPLLSLTVLSSKTLMQQLETYTKPGRNNIIEIVTAIGLHLQGSLLNCSDKSQASTVEGRIFKVFLQSGKNQQLDASNDGMSIETIKSWTEASRHRNRGKDIVKLVCMRRCLKYGLDYDDVLENVLLGHFYLIRGDVCNYHLYIGEAQRQFDLLEIQGAVGPSERWPEEDIEALRDTVVSMDVLHPIGHWKVVAQPSGKTIQGAPMASRQQSTSLLAKLSEMAIVILSHNGDEGGVEDQIEGQLSTLQDAMPDQIQASRNISSIKATDDYWVSEMVSGSNTSAPLLRLRSLLLTSFLRISSRHYHLLSALKRLNEAPKDSDRIAYWKSVAEDAKLIKGLKEVYDISTSTLSSVHLAFTIFPRLTSLTQAFAAELSSAFWSLLISNLLLQSFSIEERVSLTLSKVEINLALVLSNLESSREKESWPFVASLRVVNKVLHDVKESEKAPSRWLNYFIRFRMENAKGFTRMMKGDPVNAAQLEPKTTTTTTSTKQPGVVAAAAAVAADTTKAV